MPRGSKPGERRGGRKPGVPNKITADVKAIAQLHTADVVKVLVGIANDTEAPPAARVAACKEVLDRACGKAPQAHEVSGRDGGPIDIRKMAVIDATGKVAEFPVSAGW